MKIINSISFSGGRTSAYMAHLFKSDIKYLTNECDYEFVFCDTGAEHPKTYDFIREVNTAFKLKLVCLQGVVFSEMGKGTDYKIVDTAAVKWDLSLMEKLSAKYGGFTNNRPYCTDKMKTRIADKYRNYKHGRRKFYTWLGIRYDEPKRLVGCNKNYKLSAYKQLKAINYQDYEISDLFNLLSNDLDRINDIEFFCIPEETKVLLFKRITTQKKIGLRYLAQISKFTKQDVLNFWRDQSFDLQINDHLGNCVFCVKKSALKVTLASRDEPILFKEWAQMILSKNVRLMPADKFGTGHVYRGWLTPDKLIAQFSDISDEELRQRVYKTKDDGSCSESCEAYGDLEQAQLVLL